MVRAITHESGLYDLQNAGTHGDELIETLGGWRLVDLLASTCTCAQVAKGYVCK